MKIQFDIQNKELEIEEEKDKERDIKSVFVTFEKRSQRKAFARLLPTSILMNKLQCVKKFKIKNNSIFIGMPPDPININWKNYNLDMKEKIARRILSWAFFFLAFFLRKLPL